MSEHNRDRTVDWKVFELNKFVPVNNESCPALSKTEEFPYFIVPMDEKMISETVLLHLQVFPEYMNARLGSGYIRAFLRWFCTTNWAVALVAVDLNSRVVGYVVGAPLGYAKAINRSLLLVASTAMVLRPWLLCDRKFRIKMRVRLRAFLGLSHVLCAELDLPTPTLSLVSIAVSPFCRRKNIGQRLIEEFEQRGRQIEMRSARLSVYPENRVARGLYERCGWQSFSGPIQETGEMYYFRVLNQQIDERPGCV